ncbi:Hypothetical_protein [Hexamita inflata]|uniref:Hypothetical_protein n=1 Tax=Hexamita inflata TaxID=28002 RepID=A0AA86N681_9EUKA|nr:Hypothetical protein HINF_LOCUS1166 [Hexamita inflata]
MKLLINISERESIIIKYIIGKEQMFQRTTTDLQFYGAWSILVHFRALLVVELYLTIFESQRFQNESQKIDSVLKLENMTMRCISRISESFHSNPIEFTLKNHLAVSEFL